MQVGVSKKVNANLVVSGFQTFGKLVVDISDDSYSAKRVYDDELAVINNYIRMYG